MIILNFMGIQTVYSSATLARQAAIDFLLENFPGGIDNFISEQALIDLQSAVNSNENKKACKIWNKAIKKAKFIPYYRIQLQRVELDGPFYI